MKKLLSLVVLFVMVFTLASCGEEENTLSVYFVPSRDSAAILTATEPLKEMLMTELTALGYEFDEIIIEVGVSYEAVGEAMISGTADVGFLPGGTYALYSVDGEVDVALTATRGALNKDFADAQSWNDGLPTTADATSQVTYYRGLMVAGPSEKGQALAAKVAAGTALTWDDLSSATWCVRSSTSSSGFIYPSLWLMDRYEDADGDALSITDFPAYMISSSYGNSMNLLAAETCDVATIYADARRDYAEDWVDQDTGYGRPASIWEETAVIGVTDGIYNDTISISTITVDEDLKAAIQTAFLNIAETDTGLLVMAVYSHQGYVLAEDSDYDVERAAQDVLAGN